MHDIVTIRQTWSAPVQYHRSNLLPPAARLAALHSSLCGEVFSFGHLEVIR
jgi:hypothetical protein